jgi:hypothetical protein
MKAETVPVRDKDGNVVLYDMYVDGRWIGSRRTLAQCGEDLRGYRNAD